MLDPINQFVVGILGT